MERRIAGIIRWLERFQSSYRSGALERALLDAECAHADLEDLRLDIWSQVETRPVRFPLLGALCRVCLLTILFLLATAAPLSRLAQDVSTRQDVSARVEESIGAKPTPVKVEAPERDNTRVTASAAPRRPRAQAKEAQPEVRPQPAEKSVPYDQVFSLLQTGSRALRGEASTIKIDRKMGKGEGTL